MTDSTKRAAAAKAPRVPEAPEPAAGMSRRTLLRRAGRAVGTVLVVGAGAIGYRAYDQGVLEVGNGAAYEPWSKWTEQEGLLPLVAAAILAPSPHNAQAWLFRVGPDRIDLFADRARGTGATDPFKREMYVGLGAALENLVLAAQAAGYAAGVELLPEGPSSAHAARVQLGGAATRRSSFYDAIPMRHTNRYPYVEGKEVPPAALATMAALAGTATSSARLFWFTSSAERGRIAEHLIAATEALVADPDQSASDFE
jgi:nitroreductase